MPSPFAIDGIDTAALEDVSAAIRHDLASTIARHRGGQDAGRIADQLLGRQDVALRVVGLIDGAERVVTHASKGNITTHPFGVEGYAYGEGETLARGPRSTVPAFVRQQGGAFWDWVHPQYRWVFEVE